MLWSYAPEVPCALVLMSNPTPACSPQGPRESSRRTGKGHGWKVVDGTGLASSSAAAAPTHRPGSLAGSSFDQPLGHDGPGRQQTDRWALGRARRPAKADL